MLHKNAPTLFVQKLLEKFVSHRQQLEFVQSG
jgi:hypothetical protein